MIDKDRPIETCIFCGSPSHPKYTQDDIWEYNCELCKPYKATHILLSIIHGKISNMNNPISVQNKKDIIKFILDEYDKTKKTVNLDHPKIHSIID